MILPPFVPTAGGIEIQWVWKSSRRPPQTWRNRIRARLAQLLWWPPLVTSAHQPTVVRIRVVELKFSICDRTGLRYFSREGPVLKLFWRSIRVHEYRCINRFFTTYVHLTVTIHCRRVCQWIEQLGWISITFPVYVELTNFLFNEVTTTLYLLNSRNIVVERRIIYCRSRADIIYMYSNRLRIYNSSRQVRRRQWRTAEEIVLAMILKSENTSIQALGARAYFRLYFESTLSR